MRKPFDVAADGQNLIIPVDSVGRDLNDEFSRVMKNIPPGSMRIALNTNDLPAGTPFEPKEKPKNSIENVNNIMSTSNAEFDLDSLNSAGFAQNAPSAIPQVPQDGPI